MSPRTGGIVKIIRPKAQTIFLASRLDGKYHLLGLGAREDTLMPRSVFVLTGVAVFVLAAVVSAASGGAARVDTRLDAAEKYVAASDRYLHHSKLKRGMKGYGLTVMAGIKPVRFDAEIISVVTKWGPHLDVILVRLTGQRLEKSMIVAGMSGSPVFMKDPKDGKFKIIGAVAYGWRGQNEPVSGIQPITQMIAAGGCISLSTKPKPAAKSAEGPGRAAAAPKGFLSSALSVKKIDFVSRALGSMPAVAEEHSAGAPRLTALSTPVMVSGLSARGFAKMQRMMKPLGMVPLQAGGVNAAQAAAAKGAKLIPGGSIAVPMATGDADMTAIGTVTDVVGNKIMAFGHSFHSEGETEMPMGPAYIHTVISSRSRSFKLGTGLNVTGAITRDETSAVAGQIGRKAAMFPMKVLVNWKDDGRKQAFQYNVARHRRMTPMIVSSLLGDSAWGWRELPERHHVTYSLSVDFGKLGKYSASNTSSGTDIYWASSDLDRALFAMMNNPFGPRPEIRGIDVSITIASGAIEASIIDFRLDAGTYRPGQTVTGAITLKRPRKARTTMPVKFKLPDDLPEGTHTLHVGNWSSALSARKAEQPHKFSPKTTAELLAAAQMSVLTRGNMLYMWLPLGDGGGIALDKKELPDLPASKAAMITQARLLDTKTFRRSLRREVKADYVLSGSARAGFTVTKHRTETPVSRQNQ